MPQVPEATDGCWSCLGTGLSKVAGKSFGKRCACVRCCDFCGTPIPVSDFDEGLPPTYEGVPACLSCRDKFRAEDATVVDPIYVPESH